MAAPQGTVGQLIERLNQLDHSAKVSIVIDELDVPRVGEGGIFPVTLIPDDSDGQVFLNLGLTDKEAEARREYGPCYLCGRAAYFAVLNKDEAFTENAKRCADCAATDAANGEHDFTFWLENMEDGNEPE